MIHALIVAALNSTANPKPVRTMVYSFNYSTQSEQRQGTIHADVLGMTQDGGLVIRFSQTVVGQPSQTFAPAQCSVYGDTRVQCDKANALGTFENELAHLLGRNFVDANAMDEKNHWRVAGTLNGANVTDDFTVTSNNAGILNIKEARDVTLSGSTTHHTATITYDLNKTIPTKVQYTDANAAQPALAVTAEYSLQSDWMVPKATATPKP